MLVLLLVSGMYRHLAGGLTISYIFLGVQPNVWRDE